VSKRPKTLKGMLNSLIDDVVHPHAKHKRMVWVVDGLIHAAVERDPALSVRKFIRYNLPPLMDGLLCWSFKRQY